MTGRYGSRRYARRFNRFREEAGDTPALINRILEAMNTRSLAGSFVVELGCGTGVMSREFCRRGAAVQGFDLSGTMVRFAGRVPSSGPESDPVYGIADHRAVPLPSGTADLVFGAWTVNIMLAETLPDLREKALEDLVSETRRLAAPGGSIAFLVPEESAVQGTLSTLVTGYGFNRVILDSEWIFGRRRSARRILVFFMGRPAWKVYRHRWPRPYIRKAALLWCRIGV